LDKIEGAFAMKSVLLIVFSGTGNTLLAAEMLRDRFTESGLRADIWDITGEGQFDPTEYDVIGLGYPVYAFNTPLFFLNFVKSLALQGSLRSKRVFIFKTSGEPSFPNNASSFSLMKALKNCEIIGDYHFLMPYNIIFRFPEGLVKQLYCYAQRYSALIAANITNGNAAGAFVPISLFSRFISFVFKIQGPGANINGILYRVNRRKCTLCKRCVRDCLSKNIRMANNKFHFGFNCQMCMRCSFFCPADAITIGILNPWRINGAFRFEELTHNTAVDGNFINGKTRGPWRMYLAYFERLDRELTP
jgi:flavodoxin/ferredoxin